MRLPSLASQIAELTTPTLRIGVTGLARSGKTVFITALVRALTEGFADPPLSLPRRLPGFVARLVPQPDADVPRFPYEECLASLAGDPPAWPESTRSISQLRLSLEWDGRTLMSSIRGERPRLDIDILDYPGEWLTDLALLELSYPDWSRQVLGAARQASRAKAAGPFLTFADAPVSWPKQPEQAAIEGARLYRGYLTDARQSDPTLSTLGPGRFLLPGDLEGSPLVTFFPLPADAGSADLRALCEDRFESYKARAVRPFFQRHFSRIDRQIVIVDVLSALNGGAERLRELERTLDDVLAAFRPGSNWWLAKVLGRHRVERVLFAAAKADHLHRANHAGLSKILEKAVVRAGERSQQAGAGYRFQPLAALKATEDVETLKNALRYQCLRGVPLAGEVVQGKRFDGHRNAVVFPGDLPADPLDAFDPDMTLEDSFRFVRFQPPRITSRETMEPPSKWPHIGLDQAVSFLIGDKLP